MQQTSYWWRDEGFARAPTLKPASGEEKLYRAWGGDPGRKWGNKERRGVCFSLDRATSRIEAEMLYSVMEYQNPVWSLTEFNIQRNAPYWLGTVDPGNRHALLGSYSGNQVFVERSYLVLVREGSTVNLRNDLGLHGVHTGRMPRIFS
jgi:hypothetical protein